MNNVHTRIHCNELRILAIAAMQFMLMVGRLEETDGQTRAAICKSLVLLGGATTVGTDCDWLIMQVVLLYSFKYYSACRV